MTTVIWLIIWSYPPGPLTQAGQMRVNLDSHVPKSRSIPLDITITGLKPGERVLLEVFESQRHLPDHPMKDDQNPLYQKRSRPADGVGIIEDTVDFKAERLWRIPPPLEQKLWLRVTNNGSGQKAVFFQITTNPCGFFKTILHQFSGGLCDPKLEELLTDNRAGSTNKEGVFIPTVFQLNNKQLRPFPSIRHATGLAWISERSLLVTIGQGKPDGLPRLPTGLHQLDLDTGAAHLLWQGSQPIQSPFALEDGTILFSTPPPTYRKNAAGKLFMLKNGSVTQTLAIPFGITRILSYRNGELLVCTAQSGIIRQTLAKINLDSGEEQTIGGDSAALLSQFMSPRGDLLALPQRNPVTDDLSILLIDKSHRAKPLMPSEQGDCRFPVWSPSGSQIAFLLSQQP